MRKSFYIILYILVFFTNIKYSKTQDIILELENNYFDNGLKYFEQKDYKSALFEFRKAVIFDSTNIDARYYLSRILMNNSDFDEGIYHLNKVIENDSLYCEAYTYQSIYSLNILKDTASALQILNKAINCSSDFYLPYLIRANLYSFLNNHQIAILDYEKSLELNGLDTAALFNMGLSYYNLKEFENALNCFNKFLVLNQASYNVIFYRALCFKFLKKDLESFNDLKTIKNINCINSEIFKQNRLLIYVSLHFENSIFVNDISNIKIFLEQNPEILNDLSATRLITEYLYKSFNLKNRNEIFRYLYEKYPNNINVRKAYADDLYYCEERNLAIKEYNYCLKLDPKNGYYNYKLGMLYLQLNKMVSACKEFKKSRDLGYKPAYEYIYEVCK